MMGLSEKTRSWSPSTSLPGTSRLFPAGAAGGLPRLSRYNDDDNDDVDDDDDDDDDDDEWILGDS